MKPEECEQYAKTETQRQGRVLPPRPQKASFVRSDGGADVDPRSVVRAEIDYLIAVEEWELAMLKRKYDASKTRLRRMREKSGTNPRKGKDGKEER